MSIVFSILLCLCAHIFFGLWKSPENIIRSDAASYYAYLPAWFIYDDISLRYIDDNFAPNVGHIMWSQQENGSYLIKPSMGLALMQAPFFLFGHIIALYCSNYEANGYSTPYYISLIIAGLFYYFLGLYVTGRVLSDYFSDSVVAVILFLLTWSTNVSYYLLKEPGMSHIFSFCLFALFLSLTIKWHNRQNVILTVLLGIIYGLISLVRPTNSVLAIIFVLWRVDGCKGLFQKVSFFFKQARYIFLIGFMALLVWMPQFIYWKTITGDWLYYSYEHEGFFFLKPKIMEVLLGFRKGWLLYTPLMAFALLGLPFLYRKNRSIFWSIIVFILLNIYIISSWWCWWYGGSYGQRPFIESYVLMAFPMAALWQWGMSKDRLFFKGSIAAVSMLVLSHNIFQLVQLKNEAIHMEFMTRDAYFEGFGKLQPTKKYLSSLREPDFAAALQGIAEHSWKSEIFGIQK